MLWEKSISPATAKSACAELVQAWQDDANKVFVLRAESGIENARDFYSEQFPNLGTPVALAEDVEVGDRDHQRTEEIWMQVRFDSRHPDAYRHSANAQPLHTDGSYIPSFPNATLMVCIANAASGGETTFIDGKDVVAALEAEDKPLLDALSSRTLAHARSGDQRDEKVFDIGHDGIASTSRLIRKVASCRKGCFGSSRTPP
jgi:alpha-ketoglutarate-dependent taurine dioxygenase